MNKLWLSLFFCIFLPTLTCKADTVAYSQAPATQVQDVVEIHYGLSNLRFNVGPVQEVKIDHLARQKTRASFSLIRSAEAADFNPAIFEKMCTTVRDAGQLDDLKPVLTEDYFKLLKAKVKAGSSQYVVLAMLQSMHPKQIHIVDSRIEEDRIELAVSGPSVFGTMRGLVHLVKIDGAWKIGNESWYAGGKNRNHQKDPIVSAFNALSTGNKYDFARPTGILSEISPDYAVNRNFLSLTRVPNDRRRRALMFVFLMNKEKGSQSKLNGLFPRQTLFKLDDTTNPRARMHILWPGPKKMMPDQKILVEDRYPVDVSIAKYEDGYAPGEWNLVLPNKKPREVRVSFLWSF